MPDFKKPEHVLDLNEIPIEEEKKKNPLDNLKNSKAKKLLSKVNRDVKCIFCEESRILNPQQYQAYYDYWGDEDKITRNFICKPCEVKQNDNPFLFWLYNHDMVKRINRGLKATFEVYKSSGRSNDDVVALQNMATNLLQQNKISSDNMEFILENHLPVAIKIKNMPFIGTFEFRPYNEEKIKI